MVSESRDWEQWDRQGISQTIDSYWLSSQEEIDHRKRLAALIQPLLLPSSRFLEVGCGSGLVYQQLVPTILPNASYTGVDISDTMLQIATTRFPEGVFFKDDLYHLSFPNRAFDTVAAFEVFGHIGTIEGPIQEMFRITSRCMIFTVWTAPQSAIRYEIIGNAVFLHKVFSPNDVMQAIENALNNQSYVLSEQPLSHGITAYIIHKNPH